MRKLTSIFLILVFTLPFWVKGVVLLNFMANRTYIVEHFCENKDKPQLHCEGKCYLHKELKKSEPSEGDTQTPPVTSWLEKWEFADFDLPGKLVEISTSFRSAKSSFLPNLDLVRQGYPNIPDEPPNSDGSFGLGAASPRFSSLFIFQF